MSTKEKLLEILETNKGSWCSGESIGEQLSVTRTSVWKAVTALRGDGYVIDALRKKGYRLAEDTDVLSELGIWKYLPEDCRSLDIHVMDSVGSTNDVLWKKAYAGSPEGTVLIASMQTDGKGRLGRRFYSPAQTGIYMSILLRPKDLAPSQALRLTTMAAVAACKAIEAVSEKTAVIRWVNDIYLDGRKVSGILTEGAMSMETGQMDAVVLGIGINVYPPENGFPPELKNVACAVFDKKRNEGKNMLAAGFLEHFLQIYKAGDPSGYAEEYRRRSLVIGREVSVISANGSRKALALDVDADCRLLVRYEDGSTEHLSSGEISLSCGPQAVR